MFLADLANSRLLPLCFRPNQWRLLCGQMSVTTPAPAMTFLCRAWPSRLKRKTSCTLKRFELTTNYINLVLPWAIPHPSTKFRGNQFLCHFAHKKTNIQIKSNKKRDRCKHNLQGSEQKNLSIHLSITERFCLFVGHNCTFVCKIVMHIKKVCHNILLCSVLSYTVLYAAQRQHFVTFFR